MGLYLTFFFAAQGTKISVPFCGIIGLLFHYFLLVTFFVMAAESVELFIKLVIILGPKIYYFIYKVMLICWSEYDTIGITAYIDVFSFLPFIHQQ